MHVKNNKFFFLLFSMLIPGCLISSAQISGFNAYRSNQRIRIEWHTERESNCARFEIHRSTDRVNWQRIGVVKSQNGDSNQQLFYEYIDDSLFKGNESSINYRLIIEDQDGSRHTHHVIASVTGSSGIRHTWGSLKAMFR